MTVLDRKIGGLGDVEMVERARKNGENERNKKTAK